MNEKQMEVVGDKLSLLLIATMFTAFVLTDKNNIKVKIVVVIFEIVCLVITWYQVNKVIKK